jgi:multifunctional 2-oxoglutarate metabolism enzyme
VHLVVNNQLGFTTPPDLGRSSVYPTDVAKMVQAPIFHVNGDDPEAAVRVIRLAFAFRREFRKDVVVDLVCYRRYGHNESDEPAFTQPRMYALIDEHNSVRDLYSQQLLQRGEITEDEQRELDADFKAQLDAAFAQARGSGRDGDDELSIVGSRVESDGDARVQTAVKPALLEQVVDGLTRVPDDFDVNPKLQRQLLGRRTAFDRDEIDWALAESLAFGTIVLGGIGVRVAGQDTRRGTFSQRHGCLVDQRTETEYVPLAHLADDQARFMLYDTVLSEYAALGFEYGYSVLSDALVCWEAQFGDFANGAQIVIDQFVVAANDKWGQRSRLAMLLPHGFEGQGPEHSSARIERYLALCADGNMRVVYPSTAAQYFHVLRRQVVADATVPMVCFTPKRYLRVPQTRATRADLTDGTFELVLDDRATASGELDAAAVRRVLLCTGKLAHELMGARDERGAPIAVVRVEQLYPWPEQELLAVLDTYPGVDEVWWVQEEPENMGAWNFVLSRLNPVLEGRAPLHHVARASSASPASGSVRIHDHEQRELLAAALT